MDHLLKAIAAALNLRGTGSRLSGDYGGFKVEVAHFRSPDHGPPPDPLRFLTRGDKYDWFPATSVSVRWPMPLDLGLAVNLRAFKRPSAELRGEDLQFEESTIRDSYWVSAVEPGRAICLFTPAVRHALANGLCTSMTDQLATQESPGFVTDWTWVRQQLDRLIPLARVVHMSQQSVPLPGALLPLERILVECAAHFGLTLTRCPFTLYGQVHGCDVLCFGNRVDVDVTYKLNVRIPAALEAEFTIDADTWRDRLPFASGDVETGDAAFDRMFRVTADDEARVAAALDGPLREAMMDLHRRRALKIHEGMLSITFPRASDLASLGQDLERMVSCAKALAARMSDATTKNPTPYR